MERKDLLRKNALIIRNTLDIELISNAIVEKITQTDFYKKAQNVMIFYPIKNEISLLNLLKTQEKNFYFPKIEQNEIYPIAYKKDTPFINGKFNIPEPSGQTLNDFGIIDIVFIPALCADKNGYRLGYGKGFYDRFIPKLNKDTIKIIPIPSKLLFEKLIIEQHDKNADYIITENEIIKIKK